MTNRQQREPKAPSRACLGVGVIGYGYWGPNIARSIATTEGCHVAAIGDASDDALARAGRMYPGAHLWKNWRDVIADPSVDAVAVVTPVRQHYEMALAALRAGKHVLVEKPMTETSAQGAALIEEADRRNLILMVDHTFVYTGAVQKIRDLVVQGIVGEVYYYDSTRINLGLFQSDVNVIWDLAVHDLSIIDFLLDDVPVAISACGADHLHGNRENMAHIVLYFSSGTIAHLNVNWLAPVKMRRTLIGGSQRMIVYDDLEPSEKVKVYDRGVDIRLAQERIHEARVSYRIGDMWAPQTSVKEALVTEIEHFVDCVANNRVPLTSGAVGLNIVSYLEYATQSLNQRGHPVELAPLRRVS
ncbi:Gfo/Idh/MocA family protein [Chelatococcus asaccharovorans]|uniref:Gfo/Idh/MocA family protein n=1 Tax=Chelatococcus asaccharovorans TaxID=28210 RepID=UPI00224C66A1|nr:Gfo/Idh/MocA family oxidoreductase [Chelatococcus asaccharovorans]CAH1668178.1 putative dehydrogenase [Chelatococcus asaccharovorans]CAH1680319.1 putative dehydrogenase [Chelatococcus asaccharovorans]